MENQTTPPPSGRHRVWVTTAEACAALGMSRETLRQPPLGLHSGPGSTSVAPRERGGHDHGMEQETSAPLMLDQPDCGGGRALKERYNRSGRPGKGRNPIDA